MFRRRHAATVFLVSMGLDGLLKRVMWTTYIVFAVVELELDLQLVLLGTFLELTYLIFEVPTGVLADTVSRRLSIQIGVIGSGIGFLILGLATSFWMAVLSNVLWGLFATFESGADVAWLTDEVGEEEPEALRSRRPVVARRRADRDRGRRRDRVRVDQARDRDRERRLHLHGHLDDLRDAGGIATRARGGVLRHPRALDDVPRRRARGPGTSRARADPIVALLYGMASEGWDRLSSLHLLTGTGLIPRVAPDLPHPRRVRSGRTRDGPHDAHVRETSGAARRPRPRRQGARRDRHRDVRRRSRSR